MFSRQLATIYLIIISLLGCTKDEEISGSRFKIIVDSRSGIYLIDDNSNELIKKVENERGFGTSNFYLNNQTKNLYVISGDRRRVEKTNVLKLLNDSNSSYIAEPFIYDLEFGISYEELLVDKNENIHAFIRDSSPNGNEIFYQKRSSTQIEINVDLTQNFGISMFGIEKAFYLEDSNEIIVIWKEDSATNTPQKGLLIDINTEDIRLIDVPDINIANIWEKNNVKYIAGVTSTEDLSSMSIYSMEGLQLCSLLGASVQPLRSGAAIRYDEVDNRVEFVERDGSDFRAGSLGLEDCEILKDNLLFVDNETSLVNLYFFDR